jgi:hypothetical protein
MVTLMPVYRILKDTNLKETTRGLARLYTKLSDIVILHIFFVISFSLSVWVSPLFLPGLKLTSYLIFVEYGIII